MLCAWAGVDLEPRRGSVMKLNAILNACCLCLAGLLAAGCDQAAPDTGSQNGEDRILNLERLENGNYELCDDAGNCQELPSPGGGDCSTIEIRIDTVSGQTCQACILADGTRVEQGCSGSAVACVMVT